MSPIVVLCGRNRHLVRSKSPQRITAQLFQGDPRSSRMRGVNDDKT
jgi:hypothetical protein